MSEQSERRRFGLWVGAAVAWLAVCAGAVCAAMLGLLSVERLRSPVEIENAHAALAVAEVCFLVVIWPLFEHRAAGGSTVLAAGANSGNSGTDNSFGYSRGITEFAAGGAAELGGAVARLAGLLLLSAPLVLLALRTSEAGAADALRTQALVFLIGLAAAGAIRLPGAVSWYYPAAFTVSAVVPFAAYLLREQGGVPMGWAAPVSPFWAAGAAATGAPSAAAMILFACLGAAVIVAPLIHSRRPSAKI